MLYPKSNKFRDVYNLNGIWKFNLVGDDYIPTTPVRDCYFAAVPASINDITTERKVKDYVGKIVFEREFSVPVRASLEYRLRIGAASHKCDIYLNGLLIGKGIQVLRTKSLFQMLRSI